MRIATLAAACIGLISAATTASAVDPLANRPEAKAYLNLSFGAGADPLSSLRYGLRVDHGYRSALGDAPPIVQVDFSRQGFAFASMNGLPFAYTLRQMNQDGDEVTYGIVDWGLLLVGAAGIGFVISEIADGEDDPDPQPAN